MQLPTRQQALRLYAQLRKPVTQAVTTANHTAQRDSDDALIDYFETAFFSTEYRLQHTKTPLHALPTPSISQLSSSLSHSRHSASQQPRHLLGVDVGRRQVGLSLSDETMSFSTPLTTLLRTLSPTSLAVLSSRFRQLCDQYAVAGVVVGLPLAEGGGLTAQCEEMAQFAQQLLTAAYPPPHPLHPPSLLYWNERYTTSASRHALQAVGLDVERMKVRGVLDSAAACRILDGFMEWMNEAVQHERERLREERRQQKREARAKQQQPTSNT